MLTKKQRELLLYIQSRLSDDGVPPSFEEMKEALNLRSKSGVHRLIVGLEERGFIRRLPHRARALEVLRLPGDAAGRGFQPSVIEGGAANRGRKQVDATPPPARAEGESSGSGDASLPLYGRIAAGTPIEALRDPATFLDVPSSMIVGGEHYALEVEGDSMVEAGIQDGDYIVVKRVEGAEPGQIVVALIDDQEATLKRLRRNGKSIALEPANPRYETRIFPADRVRIQGRLVGLIRRY